MEASYASTRNAKRRALKNRESMVSMGSVLTFDTSYFWGGCRKRLET